MKKAVIGAIIFLVGVLSFSTQVKGSSGSYGSAGFCKFLDDIDVTDCRPKMEVHEISIYTYELDEYEQELLMKIGVHEAGQIDEEGIAHVMQVVLNRREDERFPDTVEEVLFQKGQFTSRKSLNKVKTTEAAENALESVMLGEYTDNEALYFESLKGRAWARIHKYLFSYEGHVFYK